MPTSLRGIAHKAASHTKHRFGNLDALLNAELLHECWRDRNQHAAYGVDRGSAEDDAPHRDDHLRDLVDRLQRQTSRAKRLRRHSIPTGDGRMRPLGIPAIAAKLVPRAGARIREAIYAQDCLRCGYGYRPQVGPRDAVPTLTITRQFGRYAFVGEADSQGCVDPIAHDWRRRRLEERLADKALLRLIRQCLKAGGLDTDGQVIHPATGTPPGGIVSPLFANVYLHDALDRWFEKVVKRRCTGEACLIRYADDVVCAFEDPADARAFYTALGERRGTCKLELAAETTRIIACHRQQSQTSVEFLGVEFRWGKERSGKAHLKRRTSRKKRQKSLATFTECCRTSRNLRLGRLFERLNAQRRGDSPSDGVTGHVSRLEELSNRARHLLFQWLNRRSQRRSLHGPGFHAVLAHVHVPRPRITERPMTRAAASRA